jgi:hypothetical protein
MQRSVQMAACHKQGLGRCGYDSSSSSSSCCAECTWPRATCRATATAVKTAAAAAAWRQQLQLQQQQHKQHKQRSGQMAVCRMQGLGRCGCVSSSSWTSPLRGLSFSMPEQYIPYIVLDGWCLTPPLQVWQTAACMLSMRMVPPVTVDNRQAGILHASANAAVLSPAIAYSYPVHRMSMLRNACVMTPAGL